MVGVRALVLLGLATRADAQCPALPATTIYSSGNLNGIVGDTSGASSTACTNSKVLSANGGCGIKCDTAARAWAPNGYIAASGSSPQEIGCSAANALTVITLTCKIKPPSYPYVTITAGDGTNAISSGVHSTAASITFTFSIKDGGGSAMNLPQLGSTFVIADVVKTSCSGSSISSAPYKLVCSKSDGNTISVRTVANAFTDGYANPAIASSLFAIHSDGTKPTVTITAGDQNGQTIANNAYNDASKVTFSFALSESVSNFALADVTKTQCNNPAFTGTAKAYKLVCDANNGQAIAAGVAAGSGGNKFTDAAANDNAASSPT